MRKVLLVKETWVPGENNWPVASHWQTLLHNVVSKSVNKDNTKKEQSKHKILNLSVLYIKSVFLQW